MKKVIIAVLVCFYAQTTINAQEKKIIDSLQIKIEAENKTCTIERIEIWRDGFQFMVIDIYGEGLGMGSLKDGKLPIDCYFISKKQENQTYIGKEIKQTVLTHPPYMFRTQKEYDSYIFNEYAFNPKPEPETIVFFPTDNPKHKFIVNCKDKTVTEEVPPPPPAPKRGRRGR